MSVIRFYASPLPGAAAGTRSQSRFVGKGLASLFRGLLALALVPSSGSWISRGAESNTPPPPPSQIEETNFQQMIRICLQIQEQLQATHLALERNRQEAKEAVAQNAQEVSKGLTVLQEAFAAGRAQEFEAMQRSNKAMLMVAGTLAGMGFLALLIMTYFQWRTSHGLAAVSTTLSRSRALGPASGVTALGPGDWRLAPGGPTGQSSSGLLGAMEQLDKRIHEFHGTISSGGGELAAEPDRASAATGSAPSQVKEQPRIPMLLNKAHSLMNLDNAAGALACFEEVLSLQPNHTEALVKKGATLERLHRLNEAIECYDRAIALDGSMTLAYLHKGGLCNRLERFKEALECYEKALRTHDPWGS